MSSTTRERIVDEAMRLFSQHGYAATSIAKIEAAAGLTPGAGGIYHHFASKEAVLAAGIERQLARLGALREIRHVLGSLGDLKAELTLTARYILAELDSESELLRILASEARNRPQLLTTAVDQLVSSTFEGFATWIGERAERADPRRGGERRSPPSGSDRCSPPACCATSSASQPRSTTKRLSTPGSRSCSPRSPVQHPRAQPECTARSLLRRELRLHSHLPYRVSCCRANSNTSARLRPP